MTWKHGKHEKPGMHRMRGIVRVFALVTVVAVTPCVNAQVISGRVTDETGAGVTRARILIRLAADTSGIAERSLYTNDRGDFHIAVDSVGRYIVSALRTGMRLDSARAVDVKSEPVTVRLMMRHAALPLPPVSVSTSGDMRCVALDSRRQSPQVREWVLRAQDLIRARRALELEYEYTVRETRIVPVTERRRVTQQLEFTQRPGDAVHLGGILVRSETRPVPLRSGQPWWTWPDEGALIRPSFNDTMCFDTTVVRVARGEYELRFQQIMRTPHGFAGFIRMRESGMLTRVFFEHVGFTSDGTLFYDPVDVQGETLPFIARVLGDSTRDRTDRRFSYSGFVKTRGRSPFPVVARR